MTKAEVAKYLLVVGSEPVVWVELMRSWTGNRGSFSSKEILSFNIKAANWLRDGFIDWTSVGGVAENRYYLTDKAKAKLQGKRRKS